MGRNNFNPGQRMTMDTAIGLINNATPPINITSDEHRRWASMINSLCRRTVTVTRDDGTIDTYEKTNIDAMHAE